MFESLHYEVRQRFAIGNKYTVYEETGDAPVLESKQKKFRLREDFRFNDPDTGETLFVVTADSVLDVAAGYDIVDARSGERVGTVKRSAWSFFQHEYALVGPDGTTVALLREDNALMAALRRFVSTLIPFSYDIVAPDGRKVGDVGEQFSFRDTYSIDLHDDSIDPRLAVIGTVIVDAIEDN